MKQGEPRMGSSARERRFHPAYGAESCGGPTCEELGHTPCDRAVTMEEAFARDIHAGFLPKSMVCHCGAPGERYAGKRRAVCPPCAYGVHKTCYCSETLDG
ncbi:hypothetical protein SEA_PIPPY_99 [Mycobacterium phage Pippy]|nr:hypothetical protein SEA_PIPPY_99 [Mycobacterium phage Pippy]